MDQTSLFLQEGHTRDLDILEQAFTCAAGSADLEKKMFWERQAKDALERLRGTVFQFENIKKEQVISACEYERIRKMLLDGEETFFQILEGVFYHAERNRGIKAYEIQVEMQAMFDSLYEDILVRYEYFPLYFEKEEMTLSEKQISTEELREEIFAIARKIYYLVTKFNIHTDSDLIRQVAEYAWENVENDISLEKIADTFFVNKTYLSHLFKQETGRNFVNFFTEIRMLRSHVLLRHHCKVYECALQLGYEDTEYFSKVFKNYYRCKPTEYMAMQNNQAFRHSSPAVCQQ